METKNNMKLISFWISQHLLNNLDELVKRGYYPNRSEAIRVAIRELIKKELYLYQRPKRMLGP